MTFEDKLLIYRGLDAYPKDWFKVLDLVEKYGGFDIEEMMLESELYE